MLFPIIGDIFILKIKFKIETTPMSKKQPRAKKEDGTCTYIILTESPCMWSGGEINKEYIKPKKIKISIKINSPEINL